MSDSHLVRGAYRLFNRWREAMFGSNRFQFFVSARYLMARPVHFSWLALITIPVALLFAGLLLGVCYLIYGGSMAAAAAGGGGDPSYLFLVLNYVALASVAVAALMPYVILIRLFFTFYTTVSLVGVSIGGAALVTVLSVMNGFEGHLRQKILGSNAHIQITQEEGEFTEWEAIRDRVAGISGVVASTPFATSEVVIAANGNYQNVVIKGIDVPSAIAVTELEKTLIEPDGLDKLEPLVPEPDLPVPEPVPAAPSEEPVVDPAPPDLEDVGDPVDYSSAAPPPPRKDPYLQRLEDMAIAGRAARAMTTGEGELRPDEVPAAVEAMTRLMVPDEEAEATARRILEAPPGANLEDVLFDRPVLDPAPDDFAGGDDVDDLEPEDFSGRAAPARPIGGTARLSTLPGVLIGSELRKTMHLYPMQEVRLVSPLADPMNPDASGTPIPFNRDYRVAGEFYTGMYEYDLKLVYVTLESLQRFLRLGDAVDGLEVRITDPDAVGGVVAAISRELGPGYRVQGWRELNRQLFTALKLEKIAMFIVLAIITLVASFSIVGTLIMIVVEKGRQIALFKTLGASDSEVVMLFVIQGSLIGLIGSLLGVAIGLGLCYFLATEGFPINPDVYYISRLPVDVDYPTVALVFLAGVLISVAATIYPSILAAQLRPAVGLKKS